MVFGTKSKRRNSEKRKAKSRDAARIRRSNETEVLMELAHQLPIASGMLLQLDKASTIRLAICHLKLRTFVHEHLISEGTCFVPNSIIDPLYHNAIDGLIMVLTDRGDFIYISENVLYTLGLEQVDLLGQSIYDYIHPCDHEDIREQISVARGFMSSAREQCVFTVRIKSCIACKTSACASHVKDTSYKTIHCLARVLTARSSPSVLAESGTALLGSGAASPAYTVVTAQVMPHPMSVDLPLDCRSFVTRHSLDMRFIYADTRVCELLGYEPEDLFGQSIYSYHHPLDGELVEKSYKALFSKGQTHTSIGYYRFLSKRGGYSWLETNASIIANQGNEESKQVVCIHCVISEVEQETVILAGVQCGALVDPGVAQQHGAELCSAAEQLDFCFYADDEDDSMQFVTEEIVGLSTSHNLAATPCLRHHIAVSPSPNGENSIARQLESFRCSDLSSNEVETKDVGIDSSLSHILDDLENTYEMKAPYIPMDDMICVTSSMEPRDQTVATPPLTSQLNFLSSFPEAAHLNFNYLKYAERRNGGTQQDLIWPGYLNLAYCAGSDLAKICDGSYVPLDLLKNGNQTLADKCAEIDSDSVITNQMPEKRIMTEPCSYWKTDEDVPISDNTMLQRANERCLNVSLNKHDVGSKKHRCDGDNRDDFDIGISEVGYDLEPFVTDKMQQRSEGNRTQDLGFSESVVHLRNLEDLKESIRVTGLLINRELNYGERLTPAAQCHPENFFDLIIDSPLSATVIVQTDSTGQASIALGPADNVLSQGQDAHDQADSACGQADSACGQADSSLYQADSILGQGASVLDQADSALDKADSALDKADSAVDQVDRSLDQADSALGQADSALIHMGCDLGQADSALGHDDTALGQANSDLGQADSCGTKVPPQMQKKRIEEFRDSAWSKFNSDRTRLLKEDESGNKEMEEIFKQFECHNELECRNFPETSVINKEFVSNEQHKAYDQLKNGNKFKVRERSVNRLSEKTELKESAGVKECEKLQSEVDIQDPFDENLSCTPMQTCVTSEDKFSVGSDSANIVEGSSILENLLIYGIDIKHGYCLISHNLTHLQDGCNE